MKSSLTKDWALETAERAALSEEINVQASRPTGQALQKRFIESGAIIGKSGDVLLWHEPNDASAGFIPDNRSLWEFFRDHWKDIQGFAHTHPEGCTGPSHTDITTFAAIELGLDLRFDWWIVTSKIARVRWYGPDKHDYKTELLEERPLWAVQLFSRSQKTIKEVDHDR